MTDGERFSTTTWVCEFCAQAVRARRAEGDDPERCENCQHPWLRGFAPGDPGAEAFTEEVHRRNQAIDEVPGLSARGRPNRPRRDETATLVVCEDDDVTLDLLCEHLAADRFGVLPAPSASDALRLCRHSRPDLLLLDLSLPDASGLDVLREIRESDAVHSHIDSRMPVIVLCPGRGCDRLRALGLGAEDYLVKPFRYAELRARIEAVLGRSRRPSEGLIRVGDLVVDLSRRRVTVGGRAVVLARREFDLLRVLAAEPTRVYSKEELMIAVWGHRSAARRRTLDGHAARLRRRLDPASSRFVVNCWGIGYRLIDG